METRQGYLLDALRGIQTFLDANAGVLGTIPQSGARLKLDTQVADLTAHARTQSGSHVAAQSATQTQTAARQKLLKKHMEPVARIAAAELPPTPELKPLQMPKRKKPSADVLHAAAMGMADEAEKYTAVFTGAGLPDDFVAQLRTAADALLPPLDARRQSRGVRKGATAGLKAQETSARKTVRVLDVLVRNALDGDEVLLARWDTVKRVVAKPGPAIGAVSAPPSAAPTVTPAVPAVPMSAAA